MESILSLLPLLLGGLVVVWLVRRYQARKTSGMRSEPAAEPGGTATCLKGDGAPPISIAGAQHREVELRGLFKRKIAAERRELDGEVDEGDVAEVEAIAMLQLEDGNPYDGNAVAVSIRDVKVGYLPRGIAPLFRQYIELHRIRGHQFTCKASVELPLDSEGEFLIELDLPRLKPL